MRSLTQLSKLIAMVLRHHPEKLGLSMDSHGWVKTKELVEKLNELQPFTMETLEEIVRTDNKQRYAFSADKAMIRANQGHSIPVDLDLAPQRPPRVLWHGTADRLLESIFRQGLKSMSRQYVHLSPDPQTAAAVGKRHGKPVVLVVDAEAMARDGRIFYLSENGVWLVDAVPPQYLLCTLAWAEPEWFDALRKNAKEMKAGITVMDDAAKRVKELSLIREIKEGKTHQIVLVQGSKEDVFAWLEDEENQQRVIALAREMIKEQPDEAALSS